jgi:hypothetical protein
MKCVRSVGCVSELGVGDLRGGRRFMDGASGGGLPVDLCVEEGL